ncbi:M48 family metallopeptidase [Rhodovastum atsumiense]|uniref:M48 family metallopeptidase n=1 Tax=Rhodovastum atsumiense TaxID=504468 RepID=UPI00139F2CB5|nr:M48 family metallopeptidase [Rhodovastum atsumiense]CAH2599168.1 M48 family metallopeptidase [Rhodovastum atsumiense]
MPVLLIAFIIGTIAWTGVSVWLSARQIAHVRQHRDRVPADFADSVPLEDHRKAADYTVARERLAGIGTLVDLGVTLGWVLGGISLLYGALAAWMPASLGRGVAFVVAMAAIGALLHLPLTLYETFAIEHRFGFNRTTLRTFIADRFKGWVIALVIQVPLLFACLWVMRSFSGLWWLWTWLGLLGVMVAAPTVYVRLIAPLFNRFAPLENPSLRARIENLLARCGFRASGLFTMDASRRSSHGNAYFIGFGRTKRIVLFDTLLDRSTDAEVEAIVAHELGHFHHHHVLFGLLRSAVITFAGLAAFGWLCKQDWLLPSFGIPWRDDALALVVCFFLASLVGPPLTLAGNWLSRRNEFQADDYARKHAGAAPMISALLKLSRDNASTLTPDPLYTLVHYSHPPVPLRVQHLREGQDAALEPVG